MNLPVSLPALKSSFKSGELYVVIVVIIGLFWLANKGITADNIADTSTQALEVVGGYITAGGAIITAVAFAAKRTWLKYKKIKADVVVAIGTDPADVPDLPIPDVTPIPMPNRPPPNVDLPDA